MQMMIDRQERQRSERDRRQICQQQRHSFVPFFAHRAFAARRALALRCSFVSFLAVALPPREPRSTADKFLRFIDLVFKTIVIGTFVPTERFV